MAYARGSRGHRADCGHRTARRLRISRRTPLWRTATAHFLAMVTATLVFLAAALVGRGGYVERDVTHRRARPNAGRPSGCAVQNVRHLEWFHDDVRIERVLFDGAVEPERGYLQPDLDRPGLGLELKRADAAHYLV